MEEVSGVVVGAWPLGSGMAAAASEQEQGNEAEITPAITDPEQQLVEERDAMTHLDYSEKAAANRMVLLKVKIMELLRESQDLRARISQLLGPAYSHRVVTTGDLRRRWLAFMETELTFIEALLTTFLKLNPELFVSDSYMWNWENANVWFSDIRRYILHEMGKLAPHVLQRAAQCFRRRNLQEYSCNRMIQHFYSIEQYACACYMHLLGNDFPFDHLTWLLFLYMSKFPYGYKFEKDRLILKWIHEDIIKRSDIYWSPSNLHDAKSLAETLFSHLVRWNVITSVASNCKEKEDEAEACQWQVNRFRQQKLDPKFAENGFIFTTDTINVVAVAASATDGGNETSSRMPRRLALHHPHPQLRSLLETMDLSQIRSLAVSGIVSEIPLQKFVNLVVLDFEGWENLKNEDLLQVCRSKMIFLRYLSVSKTRVSKLPHEIKELLFLLTMDISYTQITELPHEVFQLPYLTHLDLRGTQITELPHEVFQLRSLVHLDLRGTKIKQLPKQIVGLQRCLCHLLIGGEGMINSVETAIPHDVVHLYMLETLATVDLTEHPASFVRALGGLAFLKVLAFTWSFHQSIDRDYCEALLSSIAKWEYLESLTIHCGLGCSMEFLGSLRNYLAPPWLKKFKVTAGRFASVPPWIDGLQHLAFLQITVCNKQTTTDDLKRLGALPKLQCLILGLDFIPAQAIVIGNEGFRKLQRFSVHCALPWLTFQRDAMRRLTHLRLKFSSVPVPACEKRVPSGISNLRSIEEVALSYSKWCANSTSVKMTVKAVKEEVAKHHRTINLLIIPIVDEEAENANGTSSSGTDARPRADAQAVDEEATGVDVEAENATGTSSSRTDAEPKRDDAQAVDEDATGEAQTEITEAES